MSGPWRGSCGYRLRPASPSPAPIPSPSGLASPKWSTASSPTAPRPSSLGERSGAPSLAPSGPGLAPQCGGAAASEAWTRLTICSLLKAHHVEQRQRSGPLGVGQRLLQAFHSVELGGHSAYLARLPARPAANPRVRPGQHLLPLVRCQTSTERTSFDYMATSLSFVLMGRVFESRKRHQILSENSWDHRGTLGTRLGHKFSRTSTISPGAGPQSQAISRYTQGPES